MKPGYIIAPDGSLLFDHQVEFMAYDESVKPPRIIVFTPHGVVAVPYTDIPLAARRPYTP